MLQYLPIIIYSFILSLIVYPLLISFLRSRNIVGVDKHKKDVKVPELGGIGILLVLLTSMLVSVLLKYPVSAELFLYSAVIIIIAAVVGLMDYTLNLIDLQKVFLPLLAGIPFFILQPVGTDIIIPFFGTIITGVLFYYIIVPIAFTGACNAINMLAGLNGLETGNGIIVIGGLTFLSYLTGNINGLVLGLASLGALAGFLVFNYYPAKIFPSDVGTFTMGAVIAIIAIITKLEFFAVVMITPQILEFILKLRSNFKAENFGKADGDVLTSPYTKSYSLTHLFFKEAKFNEQEIVQKLWVFQAVFVLLAVTLYYWGGLF
jgi:UDP-N-acetylglucosamine--dolichyl-phosphate N-acetylglucosaminephosphotransferase